MPDEPGFGAAGEHAVLLAELSREFDLTELETAVTGEPVTLLRPRSAEALISEEDFERDERLPYWADLWPSAQRLADVVARMPGEGRTLLELGCGLGLVAIAALRAGWDVLATDYYEDALRFARVNAWRTVGVPLRARHLDWRSLPNDLGEFDCVVASDVLYERPYAALVAYVIARTLAPHGEALVADPGRVAADAFVHEAEARGLAVERIGPFEWREGEIHQRITVFRLRWR